MMLLTFTQPAHGQNMEEKYDKAKQLFEESKMIANLRTAESMRAALPKFEQARQFYQEINSQQYEAYCLEWLSGINNSLGNKQKALDYYVQALPLQRAINDQSGQATTLHNIGKVYSDLGEKQQALEFYNRPLAKFRI